MKLIRALLLAAVAIMVTARADGSILVPDGLQPGDTYHLIFTTSVITNISSVSTVPPIYPSFGSVDGADWIVTLSAFNAGMIPDWDGVEQVWTAMLSSSTVSLRDRVDIDGRVYNMQEQLMASGFNDLFDGGISASVAFDEFGNAITDNFTVWTGSLPTGFRSTDTAQNWTSPAAGHAAEIGRVSSISSVWLSAGIQAASGTARLYGISPAFTVPGVSAVPSPSALCIWFWLAATTLARRVRQRRVHF
jgi:hypothetical protein